ncbi:MAG TPA: hypothetical protein VJ464_28560 [Blastocatellia bacterium]|nr:hypothetical protein [Blastocatellia bacterium]
MKTALDLRTDSRASRRWGLIVFGLFALPALAAIWCVPDFVTQDGPLHLLNAHITLELLKQPAAFNHLYVVRWYPLPYWAAHLILTGLLSLVSERIADRTLLTLTSLGLAAVLVWLRWRVAGWQGMALAAPLALTLSLNMLWLLGLYSFLLGASVMFITLGLWWAWRDRMSLKPALWLALLLVIGYLSHLVSLGLTVMALVVLALATPGANRRRLGWTAASLLPLAPLAVIYHRLMQAGGDIQAAWYGMDSWFSPLSWLDHARSVDFLAIHADYDCLPFSLTRTGWFALVGPSQIVQAVIIILLIVTFFTMRRGEGHERRGWLILALLLFAVAFFGPDSFGEAHGSILRERVLLMAMAASIPAMNWRNRRPLISACGMALMVAAALQVAFVWEYALYSNRVVKDFMQARPFVGTGQRVEAIQIDTNGPYRANPLHNLSSTLGIGTGNVVWNNYGPCLYYFPVRFTDTESSQRAMDLSGAGIFCFKLYDESEHLLWYEKLLSESRQQIDALIVVGAHSEVDRINAEWYGPEPVFQSGAVRVFRRATGR